MTTALQLEPEQQKTIQTEIVPEIQKVNLLLVKNQEQKSIALTLAKSLKALKEKIEERFHPTANRDSAHKHWQKLKETENAFYDPIDAAIEVIRKKVNDFDREEAKRAKEEADRLEAERLDKENKEKEKLNVKAQKEESKGNTQKAEMLREQAENVSVAPTFTPSVKTKELIWKAKVKNVTLLCKSIAAGMVPFNVVEVRESQLNAFAKGFKAKPEIEGLEFYQDVSSTRIS